MQLFGALEYLAPNAAVKGALLLRLGLVDKGNLLAQVKLDIILVSNTINLHQRGVVVLAGGGPGGRTHEHLSTGTLAK